MTTKVQRRGTIERLIQAHRVTSQSQLCALLAREGIVTTQATVSRDLEDLGAYRARPDGSEPVYVLPGRGDPIPQDDGLRRTLSEHVVGVDRSGDLVVLRTPPAHAHLVAAALDRAHVPDVLGTVAGDDTVLVVAAERKGPVVMSALHPVNQGEIP